MTASPPSRRDTPTAGPASAGWLGADVEADGHAGAAHPACHLTGRPGLGVPEGGGGGLWGPGVTAEGFWGVSGPPRFKLFWGILVLI